MIQQTYYLHYRTVRAAMANALTIGTALLLGYLILWARF
jgi:hypothetical protein